MGKMKLDDPLLLLVIGVGVLLLVKPDLLGKLKGLLLGTAYAADGGIVHPPGTVLNIASAPPKTGSLWPQPSSKSPTGTTVPKTVAVVRSAPAPAVVRTIPSVATTHLRNDWGHSPVRVDLDGINIGNTSSQTGNTDLAGPLAAALTGGWIFGLG